MIYLKKCEEVLDIVLITGDQYVDQPSFGIAIIARYLESFGYSVGIISQPVTDEDFLIFKKPKLFFGITSGNMDTIVSYYTPNKKKRVKDLYSVDLSNDKRHKNPLIFYTNKVKSLFKNSVVVLGGVEASLRRFTYYNYILDKIENSILYDSGADLVVFGMGELAIKEIAERLENGEKIQKIDNVKGTLIKKSIKEFENYKKSVENEYTLIKLEDEKEVKNSKEKFYEFFKKFYYNQSPFQKEILFQKYEKFYIIQNIPNRPLKTDELDYIYELFYSLNTNIDKKIKVKAEDTTKFSVVTHRGCLGGCSFCSIYIHQGKIIQSRSIESILKQIKSFFKHPDFKNIISDLGGPSANMYNFSCSLWKKEIKCSKNCLFPNICKNLKYNLDDNIKLLKFVREIENIKRVFISSGIRYDIVLAQKNDDYLKEILKYHISGQMKVAPENIDDDVLKSMQKPLLSEFNLFVDKFFKVAKELDKKLYLIPYFIMNHPNCKENEEIKLKKFSKKFAKDFKQIQDFTPTPSTISTCMYYTNIDFFSGKKLKKVEKNIKKRIEKRKKFHK